jgi:hypothetical protein
VFFRSARSTAAFLETESCGWSIKDNNTKMLIYQDIGKIMTYKLF